MNLNNTSGPASSKANPIDAEEEAFMGSSRESLSIVSKPVTKVNVKEEFEKRTKQDKQSLNLCIIGHVVSFKYPVLFYQDC